MAFLKFNHSKYPLFGVLVKKICVIVCVKKRT
nr:MAG TPA: protein of unknown function (DUF5486) [Caudoviricetes sp.]